MEATEDWWERQALKRLRKTQEEEELVTEHLISEYEERHRIDGQQGEAKTDTAIKSNEVSDDLGGNPAESSQSQVTKYGGYIG